MTIIDMFSKRERQPPHVRIHWLNAMASASIDVDPADEAGRGRDRGGAMSGGTFATAD